MSSGQITKLAKFVTRIINLFGSDGAKEIGYGNRTLYDKVVEVVTPADFSAIGDGITNDDTAFAQLQLQHTGRFVDLCGKSYVVTALPTANIYFNGYFVYNGIPVVAQQNAVMIGAEADTGGTEAPYTSGPNNTTTVSGRSSFWSRVIIASNNCRAMFVRSALAACIYTWVKGNVAFGAAARQCIINGPQAVITGSEECIARGFRAFHHGSVFGEASVSSGGTLGSRHGKVGGSYVGLLATNTCKVGQGFGAEFTVIVTDGIVTEVRVDKGGTAIDPAKVSLIITDRSAGGSGATGTMIVDGNGTVTSVVVTAGGVGYSNNTEAIIIHPEETSVAIASTTSDVYGGVDSAAIATSGTKVIGSQALAAASTGTTVNANRSSAISTTGSSITGIGSVLLGGVNCQIIADRCLAFGRRVIGDLVGSFVIGDAVSGIASTINKIFQVAASGNVTAKGTFTGNTIYTDYAEFFENLVKGVIPLGTIVALVGDKIRVAQPGDEILGIVSGTALIRAGDSPLYWAQRHLTGEFGELLQDEVAMISWSGRAQFDGEVSLALAQGLTIPEDAEYSFRPKILEDAVTGVETTAQVEWVFWPSLAGYDGTLTECQEQGLEPLAGAKYYTQMVARENPEFDPTLVNIPRSERPDEWSCIGLLGQMYVRVAEGVVPGDHLMAGAGLAVKSTSPTTLRCMKITSPYSAEKGYAVAFCIFK